MFLKTWNVRQEAFIGRFFAKYRSRKVMPCGISPVAGSARRIRSHSRRISRSSSLEPPGIFRLFDTGAFSLFFKKKQTASGQKKDSKGWYNFFHGETFFQLER